MADNPFPQMQASSGLLTADEVAEYVRAARVLPPSLMTVDETAADWRVNRSTVWRRIKAKELPVVRLGGRTLVRRVDVDAYIARCVEGAV
jgi:excisionase family DNA binding protein